MVYKFDAHRLLILRELERAGSIAAAARALGYSEATLAHHLRTIQKRSEVALTQRVGRTVQLTSAGHALALRGDAIARQLLGAERDIAAHTDLTAGTLRIASFPSFCASTLPEALSKFHQQYSGVELELTEAEPGAALELLQQDACDIAIVFTDPSIGIESTHFDQVVLAHDPLRVVVPEGHWMASRPKASLADLNDETWIAGCPRCRTRLCRMANDVGFEPKIGFSTDDYLAVQRFVANGLGVAMLAQMPLDNSPNLEGVVTLDLATPAHQEIIALTGVRPPPSADVFLDFLKPAQPNLN